jgi:hypothetical protein
MRHPGGAISTKKPDAAGAIWINIGCSARNPD